MTKITIYDRAMCCSTGVCGTNPDQELVRFAADLDSLRSIGIDVDRFTLSSEPEKFVENGHIKELLATGGETALPAIVVGDTIVSSGNYPSRDEFISWLNTGSTTAELDAGTRELIAISAAIASNCHDCFKYHYAKTKNLNIPKSTIDETIKIANEVKLASAQAIDNFKEKILRNTNERTSIQLTEKQSQNDLNSHQASGRCDCSSEETSSAPKDSCCG